MSISSLMTETVTVQSLTTSQNDMGGVSKTFETRIASLPCMICEKTVSEVDQFGKRTARNAMMLYCDYNTTSAAIDVKDRIIWGSRTFEVRQPYNPAGKDVLLQIEIEEIS